MSLSADEKRELVSLLDAVREATATSEQSQRLNQLVRDDAEARQLYFDHMFLCAALRWSLGGIDSGAETKSEISNPQPLSPQYRAASPVLGFLGHTSAVLSQPILWSILVAGLAFFGYVAVITWGIRDHSASPLSPGGRGVGGEGAVATISDSSDVQWSGAAATRLTAASTHGDSIASGEPLQINSGLVELKLQQGATLLVEGPASWSIDGDNRATLKRGKLVAKVPQEAVGFTLNTPNSRIVDLGTEFGVRVDGPDSTEVQMLAGAARIVATGKTSPREPTRLVAGQAVRIRRSDSATTSVVETIKLDPQWKALSQRLRNPAIVNDKTRLVLVSGGKPVIASNVFDAGPNYPYKFPSSAVTDGLYDDAPGSWWITNDKVPQSHLIVDLEAAYTIAEIRLQNTHHGHWGDRATKDFRLSVSMNGQDFFTVTEATLASVRGMESPPFEQFPVRPVVRARYVKFDALSFYGLGAGLNELQVFAVDETVAEQDDKAPPAKKTDDAVNASQHND